MKYQVKITGHGPEALEFLGGEDTNFMVIFNENAPAELAEISVLHTIAELKEEPVVGDAVKICGKEFRITAIGSEALMTLRKLGHCTLNFEGGLEASLPGSIMLEGDALTAADVEAGGEIEIY